MLTQEDIKNLSQSLKSTFVTKEYFDDSLSSILIKLDERFDAMDARFDAMDNKIDYQTLELKDYTHQAFEAQQEYMDERFGELIMHYDVRDRVDRLEREFLEFKLAKVSKE